MSMREAINAKCRDCAYDPVSGLGTWRQQTEACTIKTCSLWPYRPKSSGKANCGANLAHPQASLGDPAC
jgi:hypothetical protein